MTDFTKAVFYASLPMIQTALNFDGRDGARIKLDIPETDIPEAAKLIAMRGKLLRVTVELVDSIDSETKAKF